MTSTTVGWVLVDERGADGITVDYDVFDVDPGAVADCGTSPQAAAARGAEAIATVSGHQVHVIAVTWSDAVKREAAALLQSLTNSGFDNVIAVGLPQAAHALALGVRRVTGFEKTAVCVIEPTAVKVFVVDVGAGSAKPARTHPRDSDAAVGQWLTSVFAKKGWQPECLFLVGSRSDLDAMVGTLDEALPMPVFASAEAQLALARGAALASRPKVGVTDVSGRGGPIEGKPAPGPSWLLSHNWALTRRVAGAAACMVALLAAAQLALPHDDRPPDDRPVANASGPPAIAQPAPPPVLPSPAPQLPRPAAEPTLAPIPAAVPVTLAVPPPQADEQPAGPSAAPPVLVPPEPITPPPVLTPQEPITPPPAAPVPEQQPPPAPDPITEILSPFFGALP